MIGNLSEKNFANAMSNSPQHAPWAIERIRDRILRRLKEKGLTLEDLPSGVRRGVSANGWIKGPTLSTLEETAKMLDMSVPELIGAAEVPSRYEAQMLDVALKTAMDLLNPADEDCPLRSRTAELSELTHKIYGMLVIMSSLRTDLSYSELAEHMVAIHLQSLWWQRDSEKS